VTVRSRLLVTLLVCLALAACVTSAARQDDLQVTVRSYENVIRWGKIPAAYDFLRPDLADEARVPDGLDQIKVTGYDRLTALIPADTEKKRFRTSATIRYVHLDRQVERSITDQQVWEWDDELERWWRANPVPAFP
jgi:hypothetical protein